MDRELISTNELAIRDLLDKLIGDQRTQEGIEPTISPLDFVPYAGLASAGARGIVNIAKSPIVSNEIGTIGSNIVKKGPSRAASELKFAKLREKLIPALEEKGAIGQGAGKFADEELINKELQRVIDRGIAKEKLTSLDASIAHEKLGRAMAGAERNALQRQNVIDDALEYARANPEEAAKQEALRKILNKQ